MMKDSVLTSEKRLSPFVKKLWRIMNDSSLQSIIHWTEHGTVICIVDSLLFCDRVLPQYFKHNNWHSFVRQLNLYGFRKVYHFNIAIDYVAGRQETIRQFKHQHFFLNGESDLVLIQRKTTLSCQPSPSSIEWNQNMQDFLSEIEKHMDEMERQNEEIRLETRYLYQKQQDQEEMMMTLFDVASSLSKARASQPQQPQQQQQSEDLKSYIGADTSYDCNTDHGSSIREGLTLPAFADVVSSLSKK